MKKTLALILAIVMMAALAVPAFAEISETEGVLASDTLKAPGDSECTVTYGVRESYTVSLPTAINFAYEENEQEATVSVSNFVINGSNKLVVTMDSENEGADNGWIMKDVSDGGKSTAVPYTVSAAAAAGNKSNTTIPNETVINAVVDGDVKATPILEVASNVTGDSGGVVLTFATEGTKQAGNYSDKITFNVSIVAITTPTPEG